MIWYQLVSHVLLSDRTNLILKKKSKEYDQVIKVDMKGIDDPIRISIETRAKRE